MCRSDAANEHAELRREMSAPRNTLRFILQ